MNSLIVPIMMSQFLLGEKKHTEIFFLITLSTQSQHGCAHTVPGPWAPAFHVCIKLLARPVSWQGACPGWTSWLMLALAQGWPQPREAGREEVLLLFLLRNHVPRAVEGSRHRTELKKDFPMGGIRINCRVLLSDLFILKDTICSARSGDNYFLFTVGLLLFQRKVASLSQVLWTTVLSPLVRKLHTAWPVVLLLRAPQHSAMQVCNKHLLNP